MADVDLEREYRRGFYDGWVLATEAMADLTDAGLDAESVYEALFTHWETALRRWRHGDCSQHIEPPGLEY